MQDNASASQKQRATPVTTLVAQAVKPALRMLRNPRTLAQLPRLLTEGVGPIKRLVVQAHNQREIARLTEAGTTITFINSFARSGNTWMRHLLADAILQSQGIETGAKLPIRARKIIPDYYCDCIARRHPGVKTPGVLIKTHDGFDDLRRKIAGLASEPAPHDKPDGPPPPTWRVVYLFRTPEDALVSFYHFHLKTTYIQRGTLGIDAFCVERLPHWKANIESYLRAQAAGLPVYFVSYERMLGEAATLLSSLLDWLEIPHDQRLVEQAVAHMQYGNLQAQEGKIGAGGVLDSLRGHKGDKGAGREELQPHVLCEIRAQTADLMQQLNQRMTRQNAAAHKPARMVAAAANGVAEDAKPRAAAATRLQTT